MSKKSGSKAVKDDTPYELRDIVLAKIRGFPAWPAMVSRVCPFSPDNHTHHDLKIVYCLI